MTDRVGARLRVWRYAGLTILAMGFEWVGLRLAANLYVDKFALTLVYVRDVNDGIPSGFQPQHQHKDQKRNDH